MKRAIFIVLLIIGSIIRVPMFPKQNMTMVGSGCADMQLSGTISLYTQLLDQGNGERSRVVGNQAYCIDHHKVYYSGQEIVGVDISTFVVVSGSHQYSFDQSNIYYESRQIDTRTTPPQFVDIKDLGSGYLTDGKKVWGGQYVFKNMVDIESFQPLTTKYAKDKNVVYYVTEPIKDADPNTFVVLSGENAQDKKYIYNYGMRVSELNQKAIGTPISTGEISSGSLALQ